MEDRIIGMITGVAVGDALGAPMQFMSHQQIEIKHGTVRDMIGGGWLHLRPGGWTNDTAMMLCLLESILEEGKFDQQKTAGKYLKWFKTKPIDIGNAVRASMALFDEGKTVDQACREAHEGCEDGSAENDTIARCAPLAALYVDDPEKLMEAAFLDARITNWDLRAASSSALLCLVLSSLLRGAAGSESIRWAEEQLMENDYGLYNPLPDIAYVSETDLKPTNLAVDTLTCAFYHFLHAKNFEEALVNAVNMGGCTDTIGAVTGALAGARVGYNKIPESWSKVIQDRGLIMSQAKRLAKISDSDRA